MQAHTGLSRAGFDAFRLVIFSNISLKPLLTDTNGPVAPLSNLAMVLWSVPSSIGAGSSVREAEFCDTIFGVKSADAHILAMPVINSRASFVGGL